MNREDLKEELSASELNIIMLREELNNSNSSNKRILLEREEKKLINLNHLWNQINLMDSLGEELL